MLIMADGYLDVFQGKTAMGLLRYHGEHVVAILNREHAGGDLEALLGIGSGIPIVGSVAEAKAFEPDSFVIGVATSGGGLPPGWRPDVRAALEAGLDVVSGLHERLTDDREMAAAATASGGHIHDLRHCDESFDIGSGRARHTSARRILTIGSDCNVGKMVVTVELAHALRQRGWNAPMVATGQTGIMVCGEGVCVDALVSDFVAGAAEAMVLKHADADAVVVEGQGALLHPGFSGVTLGLMHGVLPDLMVLVHQPGRACFRRTDIPIPPLRELIAMHESIMRPLHASKVAAVALNCYGVDDGVAKRLVAETEREVGLPVTDCLRFGADVLADAVARLIR